MCEYISYRSGFWFNIDYFSIFVSNKIDFSLSEFEIKWSLIPNRSLNFFDIFGIIGIIQSLPIWAFSLSDIEVTFFSIWISMFVELIVNLKSSLLEMVMSYISKRWLQNISKDSSHTDYGYWMNFLLLLGMLSLLF